MKIGISTACFYPLETEKSLELLGQNGVKTAEIFFNASCELEPQFVNKLYEIKEKYGIKICSVHPTMSLAESFMLFSGYNRRYEEGLSQYKRYAEIAVKLGAEYIIMHGGKPNGVLDDLGYCERFSGIFDAVKQNGATLLQENVAKYRAGRLDMLKLMAETLKEKACFCLDIKQSIRGGYSPFDVVDAVGGHIKHLHFSDHTKDNDCLLPTKGEFDFKSFLQSLSKYGYGGCAVTEVYRNAYKEYDEIFKAQEQFIKNL